jgi:hypothetical protein
VTGNNLSAFYLERSPFYSQFRDCATFQPSNSDRIIIYLWGTELHNRHSITEIPLIFTYLDSSDLDTLLVNIKIDWTQAVTTDIAPVEDWQFEFPYLNPFGSVASVKIFTAVPCALDLLLFNKNGQFIDRVMHSDSLYGYRSNVLDATNLAGGLYLLRLDVNGAPMDTSKIVFYK